MDVHVNAALDLGHPVPMHCSAHLQSTGYETTHIIQVQHRAPSNAALVRYMQAIERSRNARPAMLGFVLRTREA